MRFIRTAVYVFWQWTWGFLQSLAGLFLLTKYRRCKREFFHGAVVVYHNGSFGGISLGMFTFVNAARPEKWLYDAITHEYGHTLQSLLLGPLYLIVIGLPSALWCNLKSANAMRDKKAVSYYDFYPEKWANKWGAAATGRALPTWADDVAREQAIRNAEVAGVLSDDGADAQNRQGEEKQ